MSLREILEWARSQKMPVELLPRTCLVVDTSCVLQELDHILRFKKPDARTALQEVVDAGIVRLYGPQYLEEEVLKKLPAFAHKRGLTVELLQRAWQKYKARVRLFLPPPAADVRIRDKNDVAFLEAQRAIGADAILTADNDILESGSGALTPDVVHRPLRNFARQKSVAVTIGIQGIGGTAVAGKAAIESVKFIASRPWLLLLLGGGGLGLRYLHKKQMSEKGTSFWTATREAIFESVGELFDNLQKASQGAAAGWQEFSGALGEVPPRNLPQRVLAVLLWHGRPLKEQEIVDDLLAETPDPPGGPDANAVAALLGSDERFRRSGDCWVPSSALTSRTPPSSPTEPAEKIEVLSRSSTAARPMSPSRVALATPKVKPSARSRGDRSRSKTTSPRKPRGATKAVKREAGV